VFDNSHGQAGLEPDDLALETVCIKFSQGSGVGEVARKWQGIPGIERAKNGRLWAAWYTGGRTEDEFNYVVLVTSADDGMTWSDPILSIDPPGDVRASDPVLWHDPLGRLWLFWMQTAHCGITFDGRGGVWAIVCGDSCSADAEWSAPQRVANGIMMNKPTVLSTGEWLLPCAIWSHKGPYRHSIPEEQFSNVICSTDHGASFHLLGSADVPGRQCDEHMIVERGDGSLWMLVRRRDGIGEAISYDRGRTWKASTNIALPGPNSRFHIRRLRSGRLLLINHFGFSGRSHLTALLSEDDGATWPHHLLLDERELVTYPDAVEDPDGTIFVIYDRQRVGEGEILMQTFTEEDILRNRTPGYREREPRIVSEVPRVALGGRLVDFTDATWIDQLLGAARWEEFKAVVQAMEGEGELAIPPVRFDGDTLHLYGVVEPGGCLCVELEDSSGNPIPGYTRTDCERMFDSQTDWFVRWKSGQDLRPLVGRLVRIRFVLRECKLSGFRLIN